MMDVLLSCYSRVPSYPCRSYTRQFANGMTVSISDEDEEEEDDDDEDAEEDEEVYVDEGEPEVKNGVKRELV